MEEKQLPKSQQEVWNKLKGIGKFGLDLLKGAGRGLARAGGAMGLWGLDLYQRGKDFITAGKISPHYPMTVIPETSAEKFFYGEEPLTAKDPLNVLMDLTIRPITRRIYSAYLSAGKIEEPIEAKSFISKSLLGEEPVIPLKEEAKLYGKLSEKYLGEGGIWKAPGYAMFAGIVALDLWMPGRGKVKIPLTKETMGELAKAKDRETIEKILKDNIPELHHPKIYGDVGKIAEKIIDKTSPRDVYKTLKGEFKRIGKELGFDVKKDLKKTREEVKAEISEDIPPKPPKNPPLDNTPFEFDFNPKGKDYKVRSVFKNLWEEKPEMMRDLSQMIDEGAVYYKPFSNKELVAQSIKEIEGLTVEELEKQISHFRNFSPKTLAEEGRMAKMNVKIMALAEYYRSIGQIDKARETVEKLVKAGAEMGRAIQSFKPIYKSHPLVKEIWAPRAFIKHVKEFAETRGIKLEDEMFHKWELRAREIFKMENPPDIQEKIFKEFFEKEISPYLPLTLADKFELIRYGNMLSGPLSYLRNFWGGLIQLFTRNIFVVPARTIIEYMKNPSMGRFNELVATPIRQQWKETIGAIPIAFEYAVKSFKEGGLPSEKFIGALADEDSFEALIRYNQYRNLKMPLRIWNMPLNANEATDKFFSTLISAGEKARLTALYEAKGMKITPWIEKEIEEQAQELAERYLFRRPLGYKRDELNSFSKSLDAIGSVLLNTRRKLLRGKTSEERALGVLLGFIEPFIRTPINIGVEMLEFSPAGFIRHPSSMTSEKLAKAAIGSIFAGFAAIKAFQGGSTWVAPRDERERLLFYEHRKPMSINIGGVDVPFLYFGSLGVALAAPAAIQWVLLEKKPEFNSELVGSIYKSAIEINRFLMSQTSLSGLTNFTKVLSGEDFWKAEGYLGYTATQMIPLGGFLNWVAKLTDPVYRKTGEDFWGPIKANLPFVRKSLEAYENLTGEARMRTSDLFTPYGVRAGVKLPLTLALQEVQIDRLRRKAYDGYMRKAMKIEDIKEYVEMLEGKKVELSAKNIKEGLKILDMLKAKTYDSSGEKRAAAYFMASFIPELYKHFSDEEVNKIVEDIPEDLADMAYNIAERRKVLRETPYQIPEAIKGWSAEKKADFLITYLEEMGKILEGEVFDDLVEELRDRGIMTSRVEEYMWSKLKTERKIKEHATIK